MGKNEPKGKNISQLQLENRSTLLKLLRSHKHIWRKDLAEMSGLTGAAVTYLIRDLIEVGLVSEDREYTGPRSKNAIPLKINYERFLVIGVSIRRGRISRAVADLSGKIIASDSIRFDLTESAERVMDALVKLISEYIADYGHVGGIVGIGLSVPGPINLERGEISYLTNLPGWKAIPIRRYLEERFDIPVMMDEDANAAALAEKWLGSGRNHKNLISILVGKGVGAGVIMGGHIYHGAFGLAGEIGHMSINFEGPLCECGNKGCLELYASTLALMRRAEARYGIKGDFQTFRKQVAQGHDGLEQMVIDAGRHLGYGITNLVYAFNPELVALHGDMTLFGPLWLENVRGAVAERLPADISSNLRIEVSTLPDPVLLGTVAMVCEHLFENPVLTSFTSPVTVDTVNFSS